MMDERGKRDILGVAFLATIFFVFWLASILNVALRWDIMRHNPTDEIKAKVPQNIEMKPMKSKGSDDIGSIESGLTKPKQSEDIVSKPIEV